MRLDRDAGVCRRGFPAICRPTSLRTKHLRAWLNEPRPFWIRCRQRPTFGGQFAYRKHEGSRGGSGKRVSQDRDGIGRVAKRVAGELSWSAGGEADGLVRARGKPNSRTVMFLTVNGQGVAAAGGRRPWRAASWSAIGGYGSEEDRHDGARGTGPGQDRLSRAGAGEAGSEACGERDVEGAGQGK